MPTASPRTSKSAISELKNAVRGRVTVPGDENYDAERTVMYGGIDARPAAVVRVADADDVARVVDFARDHGFELAVRSGGHSIAGHSTTEGGIVLDVRDLKRFELDPATKTAWAETGLTAKEFSVEAAKHELAVGFGDAGSVGIGGIALGGGVGFLTRKHGLTIDSILAAEIVTADGRKVTASPTSHPDLFWAVRGGGGNFGVVTRLKFQLHPLKQIVGGILILPATADSIAGFIAAAEAASEDVSTIANVMPAPPMPFLPSEQHGKTVIFAMIVYAGDAAVADKALAPFRAVAKPLADMLKPMPYPDIYPPEDPNYHPAAVARTMFIDHVGKKEAQLILDRLAASDASLRVAQLRVLGGAAARVPADATAYAHRKSKIMVNVAAFYDGLDDKIIRERWVTDFASALRQRDNGAYVNFLGDEGEERIRAAYPGATWDRL